LYGRKKDDCDLPVLLVLLRSSLDRRVLAGALLPELGESCPGLVMAGRDVFPRFPLEELSLAKKKCCGVFCVVP